MRELPKYSFGMGDRFGAQGKAQLQAILQARSEGIEVCPVWNKSHREHTIVGTEPMSLREEADAAVEALGWTDAYFVDADHINLETVGRFAAGSDFFTLDVAEEVGKPVSSAEFEAFLSATGKYVGSLPAMEDGSALELTRGDVERAAEKFLAAIGKAGEIYRRIVELKGGTDFVTEVSIDETDEAQSPGELFCILAMAASEQIPIQTVAPKFTGRFNKGVDYVGDLAQFENEFEADLLAIKLAVSEFGLPSDLKLSVHSGSDKFSLYPIINRLIEKHDAGLHLKTAGTTWLEELIGLAEAGGAALDMAKRIYVKALAVAEDLILPYRTVVDIDSERLPSATEVEAWTSEQYVTALRHDQSEQAYNLHFRQLLHVAFKIAAKDGPAYRQLLQSNEAVISKNVTENLLDRHIRKIFGK